MSKPLEDCFAESLTQEIGLDREILEGFIRHLGKAGELQYFPTFARPFFRLFVSGRFTITGIQGNVSMRVVLCHDNKDQNIAYLKSLVGEYCC